MSNDPMIPGKDNNFITRTFTSMFLYRDYRFLWLSSWSEHLGEWMEMTALLWLINEMTHSPFMGTLMVTLRFLPRIIFAFMGGIIADRVNRRNLLNYTLLAAAVLSITLAALVHANLIQPWHLLLYTTLMGIATSFNHPARSSLLPNLVKKEHYLNAITLDNAAVMVSRIVGAPLAGLIIALFGTTPVLGLKAVGAILAIFCVSKIHSTEKQSESKKESHISNFMEGIHYIWKNKIILTQVLLYLIPFFINNSYTGLLPYYATNVLQIGADLYGIMNAAPGAGSAIAILILASRINLRRKAFLLILAGIIQGVSLIAFGFLPAYLLSILLIIIIGGAGTIYEVLNNTLIQEMIPDQVRGRVMSLREVAFGLGPSFSLITGSMAGALGVSLALGIAGGVPAVILLAILIVVPRTRSR